MATSYDYATQLEGFFKRRHGPKLYRLVPDNAPFRKILAGQFKSPEKVGEKFVFPVYVRRPHGFTYAISGETGISLNSPIVGRTTQAEVVPNQLWLRDRITQEAAKRAATSECAYGQVMDHVVTNMKESFELQLEAESMYGGSGLATIANVGGTPVWILTTAEFAPGLWSSAEGMRISVYNGAALVGHAYIVSADSEARTIKVDVDPGAGPGNTIYAYGAYGKEMVGLHKMLANTSGAIHNIDPAAFILWKATQSAVGGVAFSLAKVLKGVTQAMPRGLDSSLLCLVNPFAWRNLCTDEANLKRHGAERTESMFINGAETIKFYGPTGTIEIVASVFVKEGYAYGIDPRDWFVVGANDVDFTWPGLGRVFLFLDDAPEVELRAYFSGNLVCCRPARQILWSGIVNAA